MSQLDARAVALVVALAVEVECTAVAPLPSRHGRSPKPPLTESSIEYGVVCWARHKTLRAKSNVWKADNRRVAADNPWTAMQTATEMLMQTATEMP